jgi:hypothetical protein
MAHITDRWFTGGQPTGRHGRGKRWKAGWTDPGGAQRYKSFARRVDAEQFLAMKEKLRVRAELLAADGDGIDPAGFYVYLLWAVQGDDAPVYVGRSGNILARLGTHLGDAGKRPGIGWVTLIRCTSELAMVRREAELIRKYRPSWNRHVPAEQPA